jgi:twitching motility protein PilI
MARENRLRDFQEALAHRLREAVHSEPASRLGMEAGAQRYLLRLDHAGEVLPVPEISTVPLTRGWFRGLANVRGNLVSVVDFAAFMGEAAPALTTESRLVLLADRFGAHCGLLVCRTLGLKNLRSFEPRELSPAHPWIGAAYADRSDEAKGRIWLELEIGALAAHETFLQAGL